MPQYPGELTNLTRSADKDQQALAIAQAALDSLCRVRACLSRDKKPAGDQGTSGFQPLEPQAASSSSFSGSGSVPDDEAGVFTPPTASSATPLPARGRVSTSPSAIVDETVEAHDSLRGEPDWNFKLPLKSMFSGEWPNKKDLPEGAVQPSHCCIGFPEDWSLVLDHSSNCVISRLIVTRNLKTSKLRRRFPRILQASYSW